MEEVQEIKMIFILAHPDDESFLPSGTIAKYAAEDVRVIYICATRGENGRVGECRHALPPDELKMIRYHELEKACATLGISDLYELDYPDGHLAELIPAEPIRRLVTFLRIEQPEVVITFDPTGISNHTDHKAVHHWVAQAFNLCNNPFYQTSKGSTYLPAKLYYLTIPSHHMRTISDSSLREKYDQFITTIIDVSDYLVAKQKAIECHQTQCFNIKRIFKFAGGKDDLEKQEYYVLARCNLQNYAYEVVETDLLGGIVRKVEQV